MYANNNSIFGGYLTVLAKDGNFTYRHNSAQTSNLDHAAASYNLSAEVVKVISDYQLSNRLSIASIVQLGWLLATFSRTQKTHKNTTAKRQRNKLKQYIKHKFIILTSEINSSGFNSVSRLANRPVGL